MFSYSKTAVSESRDEQLGHTMTILPELILCPIVESIGEIDSSNSVLGYLEEGLCIAVIGIPCVNSSSWLSLSLSSNWVAEVGSGLETFFQPRGRLMSGSSSISSLFTKVH